MEADKRNHCLYKGLCYWDEQQPDRVTGATERDHSIRLPIWQPPSYRDAVKYTV